MLLDSLTLMATGSFVCAIATLLLFGAWTQLHARALLWWAAASAASTISVGILAFGMRTGNVPATIIGVGLNPVCAALTWAGARAFSHRRQNLPLLAAGVVGWLAASAIPFPGGPQLAGSVATFAAWIMYLLAAIGELLADPDERFITRWPLAGFLGLHSLIFVGGIVDALSHNFPAGLIPPLSSWFSLIQFESLIYSIGTSVFMVLLCNDRSEHRRITAARSDSLTGIANRGVFIEGAERILERCRAEGRSFSLIMFDLDRFKRVNDTYGHTVGDAVIRGFADAGRSVLRPSDLFGRYGGEEFTVALPGATIEAAHVIAERIRYKFAESCATVEGRPVNATVSAGIASAVSATTLQAIVDEADQALYRAKHLGRNRVERATGARDADAGNVVRIA